ncbi:hypothetical protein OSTOST_17152, partial [Ostertagia ostertagi]
FYRKPRRGRGAASAATGGGTRPNGYHSSGGTRGRGVGRPPLRTVTPAPPPPPPKFVLHDVICPHTTAYLGALSLPKFASVQPEGEIKEEEIADCDEEKPSTSKGDGIKEEVSDERSDSGSGSSVILLENGECDSTKEKTGDENKENGATTSRDSSEVSKEESTED